MDWKSKYSLGIEEIDAQHKLLLGHFAKITAAVLENAAWSEVHYLIVDLRKFAEFHFEFEEALMRLYGYHRSAEHATTHREFFEQLDRIERSSIVATVKHEVVRFLCDWLTKHILVVDRDYAQYILAGAPLMRSAAPAA